MNVHVYDTGLRVKIKDLSTTELSRIVVENHAKADAGILTQDADGQNVRTVYGKEALDLLNNDAYAAELVARAGDSVKEYPLYPSLPPEAAKEAQLLMDRFKAKMAKICEETLANLYTDLPFFVESARNHLLAGLCDYGNRKLQAGHDFAKIRRAIFEKYKDEIIADLNQDLVARVKELEEELEIASHGRIR